MKSKEILLTLEKEAGKNKISGSYLFYGDKRVDLLFYALEFSKMVMTGNVGDEEERKDICKRIESLQHPDVEIINRKNENIKIDEIREIIYGAIESAYSSPKKIFILSGIENIRKESSNALLKILEEPPKDVYFVLLSRSLNIIPTIKSRTIKFHLESLDSNELGVSSKVYQFFDGNENDIRKYKKSGISLDEYENCTASLEDVLEHIKNMRDFMGKDKDEGENLRNEMEIIVRYNMGIEYLVKKIRFSGIHEIYVFINEIEKEYKNDKEILMGLLGKITAASRVTAGGDNLKKMINLKNSIRSNVNIRSVLFNYFSILQGI